MGQFLAYNGGYVWFLEFIPAKYRLYANTGAMLVWVLGYPVIVASAYFIETWNYIYIAATIVAIISYLPYLIFPDSPR